MKVVLTCGGTAGHINPAIAVAGRLKELVPDCDILFIGANGHMETELVPREGYNICTLTVTNISRGHDVEALRHNIETIKIIPNVISIIGISYAKARAEIAPPKNNEPVSPIKTFAGLKL